MTLVDFGVVKEELARSDSMHTSQILVRDSKYMPSGNIPAVLILTDNCFYHGGTEACGGKFKRIRMGDIYYVKDSGSMMWRSIEVKFRDGDKVRSLFICPFTGELHAPEIDEDAFQSIIGLFKRFLKNE
ncbi:MAG: hypothetical protein ABIH11_06990 [Candidatus Altiarchaeota archaeon]